MKNTGYLTPEEKQELKDSVEQMNIELKLIFDLINSGKNIKINTLLQQYADKEGLVLSLFKEQFLVGYKEFMDYIINDGGQSMFTEDEEAFEKAKMAHFKASEFQDKYFELVNFQFDNQNITSVTDKTKGNVEGIIK